MRMEKWPGSIMGEFPCFLSFSTPLYAIAAAPWPMADRQME